MSADANNMDIEHFKISQDEQLLENGKVKEDTAIEFEGTNKRDSWSRGIDFLVACIGGSIGLGNVWRFPYLCYKNGGGAFLIPYFTCMLFASLPLFIMETSLGQYMTAGGLKAWNIVPLFQGIGLTTTIIIYFLNIYYNMILGWAILYFFHSFSAQLPWNSCDNDWNTPLCTTNFTGFLNRCNSSSLNNASIVDLNIYNSTNNGVISDTLLNVSRDWSGSSILALTNLNSSSSTTNTNSSHCKMADPVTEFWERKILAISEGIHDMGSPKWDLVLSLFLAWVLVYLAICKGIKSSGKVMYITAPVPYIFMIIILIRNATLDGASDGVTYYIRPNITRLTDIGVWTDAGKQIFYSSSVCMNMIITMGSYNKFKHNSCRDSVAFGFVNSFTSIFSGFLVFTILGFMAFQQNLPVSEVAESGPGLAFIAYPKAVAQMPLSQFWSATFFLMLLLLALDSQFMTMEAVITTVMDQFPHLLRIGKRKEMFIAAICAVTFLFGIVFTFNGGVYVLTIFDSYCAGKNLILMGFLEAVAISYFYGFRRFFDNMEMMVGRKWTRLFRPYLSVCWLVATPCLCLLIVIMGIVKHKPLTYNRPMNIVYEFPVWADVIGWTFTVFSIIWIPILALHKFYKYGFTKEVFKLLLVPYDLKPHQKRPQDKCERSLKSLELETREGDLLRTRL